MRVRVLGPVQVEVGGRWLTPGPPKQRAVLATLALNTGRGVSALALTEMLWAEDPPASAVRNVQMYVWRLRQLVGERLRSRPPGYVLNLAPEELDATEFADLLSRGRRARDASDLPAACELLRRALDLWQGPALADVVAAGMAQPLARHFDEERARARYDLIDVEVDAGSGASLLPRLESWIAERPLDEPLRERHVDLLLKLGRPVEALAAYRGAVEVFGLELGTRPGPNLDGLAAVARRELPGRPRAADPEPVDAFPPRMLPPTASTFVGRRAEVARLTDLLAPRVISVPVVALVGAGGLGKSALALRVAHRLADVFPDGQLYVDLKGSSPDIEPVHPGAAVRSLLVAMGVPAPRVPADPRAATALLRARMSGRGLLLVLDDAAGVEQVRPLLPGVGGCAVLITARRPLTELAGVVHVQLDAMPDPDAAELLTVLIGADRIARSGAEGLAGVIEACGGLPLALRIAGARFAARPSWSLPQFGRRLSDERHRLNELCLGDLAVRTTFAVSYRHLSDPARLVFRRIGLFPGPEFGAEPLALLTGLAPAEVTRLLESLVDAGLSQSNQPGRYHLHDLVRIYAIERSGDDAEEVRHAAFERLALWYLGVTDRADRLIRRTHGRTDAPAGVPEEPRLDLKDRTEALAWFEAERPTLLALVRVAAQRGLHGIAAQLPSMIKGFLEFNRYTDDWIACHQVGLDSALRSPDRTVQARILNGLGSGYWRQERLAEAIDCYRRSLELVRALGDRAKEAVLLNNLGIVYGEYGDHAAAVTYLRAALAMYPELGGRIDESYARHNLGHVYHEGRRFEEALPLLRQALTLRRDQGNRVGEGMTLHCLADTMLGLGHLADADELVRQALTIFVETGDRYGRAAALHTMGRLHAAQGRVDDAVDRLRDAEATYRELGSTRDAASARADRERAVASGPLPSRGRRPDDADQSQSGDHGR